MNSFIFRSGTPAFYPQNDPCLQYKRSLRKGISFDSRDIGQYIRRD